MASIGRKLSSVGTLLGAIGLVRIQVLIRRTHAAHPREMADLLARLGYSEKSVQPSLLIVAYQYAVLRRPFLEVRGTSLERERSALLLWFAVMFTGGTLGVAGIVMEILEDGAI
jgi:hypothetical protein